MATRTPQRLVLNPANGRTIHVRLGRASETAVNMTSRDCFELRVQTCETSYCSWDLQYLQASTPSWRKARRDGCAYTGLQNSYLAATRITIRNRPVIQDRDALPPGDEILEEEKYIFMYISASTCTYADETVESTLLVDSSPRQFDRS